MAKTPRSTWKPPSEITPIIATLLRTTLTLSPGFKFSLVRWERRVVVLILPKPSVQATRLGAMAGMLVRFSFLPRSE